MQLLMHNEDTAIGEQITVALAEVEVRFGAELLSDLPCVNQLVAHVEQYRGKMLRPMLVLVAGMASLPSKGAPTDPHVVVATVVEMVHMATLVHDDILDEAKVRRGGGTINHLKGNEAAVMLGDYLISHAYHLCSSLGSTRASRVIADTTNTVCEGELLQLANRGNASLDEQTYFEIIRRKTGSLCGACCCLGAMLNNVPVQVVDSLYEYGENLGVAFQIVDDLLDLIGTEKTVGKTLGQDLQKRKLTLPLIHYLKSADLTEREPLLDWLSPGELDSEDPCVVPGELGLDPKQADRVRGLIISKGSVVYANQWAERLIDRAKAALGVLEPSPAKSLLMTMADAVLTRKF